METNLFLWWKELNHNLKKNLIANFDFFVNKIEIKPYNELYSQYKIAFGRGIRERLDNFNVNEKSLSGLTNIASLVINHSSFLDFSYLAVFTNLETLYFSNNTVENLDTLNNMNIKTLTLSCSKLKSLDGIEKHKKLENLKLIYCYDLDNLNSLVKCSNLIKLDLTHCGRSVLFDRLIDIAEIHIGKHLIYPNEIEHTLYRWEYSKNIDNPYEFSKDETQFIMEKADRKQRDNYLGLILSNKFQVSTKDFSEWILRRTTAKSSLPKASLS